MVKERVVGIKFITVHGVKGVDEWVEMGWLRGIDEAEIVAVRGSIKPGDESKAGEDGSEVKDIGAIERRVGWGIGIEEARGEVGVRLEEGEQIGAR